MLEIVNVPCVCGQKTTEKFEFDIPGKGCYHRFKCMKCGVVRYSTIYGDKLHPRELSKYLERQGMTYD